MMGTTPSSITGGEKEDLEKNGQRKDNLLDNTHSKRAEARPNGAKDHSLKRKTNAGGKTRVRVRVVS